MSRVAIYARFSSDLQRETSLEDQIATARRYAEAQGWSVTPDQVYTDAALSGASLDRPGIQALLAASLRRPAPFDVLLVDDSSRISRDLADAIRILQQLKFAGVRVIYISQNIDSTSEQAETLVAVHGMVDGLYLKEMSAKVRRGLRGQLERGFATGSITFGYRSVPVQDPSGKTDPNGYPALLGKRIEIIPSEARTVVQIFEWFAGGLGASSIVEKLNRAGLVGPRGETWKHGAVKRLLLNEQYAGRRIWGRRRYERRPGTQQKIARALSRDQWHVQDAPELRIISAELWERAEARRAVLRASLPPPAAGVPQLMRGRNAALFSPNLFSGFMRCATCGGAITAVNRGNGSPRYGCSRSHRNGLSACDNRVTVMAKVVDPVLLSRLQAELVAPDTVQYVIGELTAALNRLIDDRPKRQADLRAARDLAVQRAQRLVAAIESGVSPATIAPALAEREAEIQRLESDLAQLTEPLERRLAVMPTWVQQQLSDLAGLLRDTPQRTKAEFQRLGLNVVMHPIRDEQPKPFYRALCSAGLPALAGTYDLSASLRGGGSGTSPHPAVDRLGARAAAARSWSPGPSTGPARAAIGRSAR